MPVRLARRRVQSLEIRRPRFGLGLLRLDPQVLHDIVHAPIEHAGQVDNQIELGHPAAGHQFRGIAPQRFGEFLACPPFVVLGEVKELGQT